MRMPWISTWPVARRGSGGGSAPCVHSCSSPRGLGILPADSGQKQYGTALALREQRTHQHGLLLPLRRMWRWQHASSASAFHSTHCRNASGLDVPAEIKRILFRPVEMHVREQQLSSVQAGVLGDLCFMPVCSTALPHGFEYVISAPHATFPNGLSKTLRTKV